MYIIDSESYSGFRFDCEVPRETLIEAVVVTGTHSSGKSTLLEDYGTHSNLLEEVTGYKIPTGFAASYEDTGGLAVPVVIAPEAATYYAEKIAKNSRVVTDQYTLEDQIYMEGVAKRLTVRANVVAAHLAHLLQPNLVMPLAIVASDRSQLDGHVYSAIRLPDAEHELIDMSAVAKATGGVAPASYSGQPAPYRENARLYEAESLSIAFVAEHSDIPFETSDLRVNDSLFRDQIALAMKSYYTKILGEERIVTLNGNRIERLNTFRAHLRTLAQYMIYS